MASAKINVPVSIDLSTIQRWMDSADIVEVVRCRDCKYSRPYRLDEYTCEKEHDCGDYTTPADWYCADGERRESE